MSVFLLCMLMPDVMLRTRRYAEERWRYAAEEEYPAAQAASATANGPAKTDADDHSDGESGPPVTDPETSTGE